MHTSFGQSSAVIIIIFCDDSLPLVYNHITHDTEISRRLPSHTHTYHKNLHYFVHKELSFDTRSGDIT